MLMGFCLLLVLAATPLLGGDLRRLAALRLRGVWLVFTALVVQVLIISVLPGVPRPVAVVAHVLTYVGALVVITLNRRIPGLPVLGLGTLSNAVTIALNGGTLPARPAAVAAVNIHKLGKGLDNSAILAHPRLAWLGDVFASPSFLPFRNVMSVGDLLILAGGTILVLRVAGARVLRLAPWGGLALPGPVVFPQPGPPPAAELYQATASAARRPGHPDLAHPPCERPRIAVVDDRTVTSPDDEHYRVDLDDHVTMTEESLPWPDRLSACARTVGRRGQSYQEFAHFYRCVFPLLDDFCQDGPLASSSFHILRRILDAAVTDVVACKGLAIGPCWHGSRWREALDQLAATIARRCDDTTEALRKLEEATASSRKFSTLQADACGTGLG